MSEVMYLYAVADSDLGDADVTDMPAVDGAPVHIIAEAPIAAVVSAVDAERFSAPALRRQLEDLHWLEDIARAHNAVVSQLAQGRPIAPLRLATVRECRERPSAAANPRAGFRGRARPGPRLL
jgi:gas vesicle protein GvpL/GvpF